MDLHTPQGPDDRPQQRTEEPEAVVVSADIVVPDHQNFAAIYVLKSLENLVSVISGLEQQHPE